MKTINLDDVSPITSDDIGELLEKARQIKNIQTDLNHISKDIHINLVMKFIDSGQLDALQVKPSILKRY